MKRIERTAIVGMGALGMLYGTHMMKHGDPVTYLMDPERLRRYGADSFTANGEACELKMEDSTKAGVMDLILVAVKYNGLADAMEMMAPCVGEDTIILSVLNGITSEEILGERFGKEHLIYSVAQGMDAMKFGSSLTYTVMGELRIGAKEECQKENLQAVVEYFDRIQMPYTVDEDIMKRMWGKFMLNVGINQSCMVYETNYGGCLVPGEPNRTMIAAMREVIALSGCEGIGLDESDLKEYLRILGTLSPEGMPSMRQDGLARRPSEVEMFSGAVRRMAARHGLVVPANDFLYERVKAMEASYNK